MCAPLALIYVFPFQIYDFLIAQLFFVRIFVAAVAGAVVVFIFPLFTLHIRVKFALLVNFAQFKLQVYVSGQGK